MLNHRYKYKSLFYRRISFFDITWILFLGVLPFDKAALTLYQNEALGEMLSLLLNALAVLGAFLGVLNIGSDKIKQRLTKKYILFFFVLAVTYLMSAFVEEVSLTRFFSMCCLLGYYLFAVCRYDNVQKLLRDVNRALLFIIALSLVLYLMDSDHVMYVENAYNTVFKGIAENRNSYSEITLFYIVTNFALWHHDRKKSLWRLLTTFVAVYTTFLTNGATSIICVCALLLFLFVYDLKVLRKLYSFNIFLFIYMVLFGIIVLSQYSDWGIMRYIAEFFGKTTSLTGRTDIWSTAIRAIFHSPIVGLGYETSALLNMGIAENDPHNGLLYIALTQGLIGIVSLAVMLWFIVKNDSNKALKNDSAYMCMLIFVVVWLIKGLVESVFSYTHFVFWCALIVMEIRLHSTVGENNG